MQFHKSKLSRSWHPSSLKHVLDVGSYLSFKFQSWGSEITKKLPEITWEKVLGSSLLISEQIWSILYVAHVHLRLSSKSLNGTLCQVPLKLHAEGRVQTRTGTVNSPIWTLAHDSVAVPLWHQEHHLKTSWRFPLYPLGRWDAPAPLQSKRTATDSCFHQIDPNKCLLPQSSRQEL